MYTFYTRNVKLQEINLIPLFNYYSEKLLLVIYRSLHLSNKHKLSLKAGFHMIATIATIAAIAGIKRSAIVPIMWKPRFSNRSDHSNHVETSPYENCLAIEVATTRQLFW